MRADARELHSRVTGSGPDHLVYFQKSGDTSEAGRPFVVSFDLEDAFAIVHMDHVTDDCAKINTPLERVDQWSPLFSIFLSPLNAW